MTEFIQGVFERLLRDPNNKRICDIGLAVSVAAFAAGMLVSYLISH